MCGLLGWKGALDQVGQDWGWAQAPPAAISCDALHQTAGAFSSSAGPDLQRVSALTGAT